ncbi:SRPBCC domain-containing protein [Methylobacterium sp. J-070]|uniref:SRPBCC domain-containing protein n=1 Tax=Methylobacterium sp. J-070 TaxID=2836650 RepID=UPI001FB921F4|nr:SRPBCC domain-containing protein [Methylobacterium sp. J-070]MCJ2048661.1 SRPBCC domain-containing protein [Methylobacterium sp. J-070]
MAQDRITVAATAPAPVAVVWDAYTSPDQITQWNFASDDWHCPSARVDLREGGTFSSRMEAKDGSGGFDFDGTYTRIIPHARIEYAFGDRHAVVEFTPAGDQTGLKVSFDPDTQFPRAQQQSGWAAILDNFCRHVARR